MTSTCLSERPGSAASQNGGWPYPDPRSENQILETVKRHLNPNRQGSVGPRHFWSKCVRLRLMCVTVTPLDARHSLCAVNMPLCPPPRRREVRAPGRLEGRAFVAPRVVPVPAAGAGGRLPSEGPVGDDQSRHPPLANDPPLACAVPADPPSGGRSLTRSHGPRWQQDMVSAASGLAFFVTALTVDAYLTGGPAAESASVPALMYLVVGGRSVVARDRQPLPPCGSTPTTSGCLTYSR